MKLLLLLGVLLLPVSATAQTINTEAAAIFAMMNKSADDWSRGDLDAFATSYKNSPDILFIGRQVSRGYENMLADYKGNYPNQEAMGTLAFSDLEPHLLDEHYAILVGRYHLSRSKKAGGDADGIFSLVLEKTTAGWKIILDHTT
jgi:ketosteroid isomerase-like protein